MSKTAYFDNAATTQVKPQEVHDFMYSFYAANSVNVGRSIGVTNDAEKLIRETRDLLLSLFKATRDTETVFAPTATEAINTIIQGLQHKVGDNLYISPLEHNAIYRVVRHIEKTYKINVHILAFDKQKMQLDFESIKRQFATNKPSVVAVTHASNVCGAVLGIEELGELVKKNNATYIVDCAQSAGLLDINMPKSRADFMVFAGHKTLYGPFGCSGFLCSKNTNLKPLIYGGTGIDSASEDMPKDVPIRFEAGSQNIMAIAGLNAALKWIEKVGRENIYNQEQLNYDKLNKILNQYDFIKIIGNSDNSVGIISCVFKNLPADSIGQILSEHNITVRTGLHCAPLAHKLLGTFPSGTVRFSVSYFTSDDEFTNLIKVLKDIQEI